MKKQPIFTILLIFLATCFANASEATTVNNEINTRAEIIINRVEEIREMDKSSLTSVEKKALKEELKDLKKEAKEMGLDSRVSISVGALIIILLLLIIIL
ncbi:MAG: hypothetical protein RLO17_08125 [Cyclobacteriaceae bacterium]